MIDRTMSVPRRRQPPQVRSTRSAEGVISMESTRRSTDGCALTARVRSGGEEGKAQHANGFPATKEHSGKIRRGMFRVPCATGRIRTLWHWKPMTFSTLHLRPPQLQERFSMSDGSSWPVRLAYDVAGSVIGFQFQARCVQRSASSCAAPPRVASHRKYFFSTG